MADSYDLIVIGGGPGGYTAAIRARQLGLRCALVERERLGGVCLNWGCIPTKALLHAAEAKHQAEHLATFGLSAGAVEVDLSKLVKRSRQIAERLSKGVAFLMKKNQVDVFAGEARFTGPQALHVTTQDGDIELSASNVIIATGARARALPGVDADGKSIVTYKEAMLPGSLPASLLVIGAGAIGVEFASFYADLGSAVTIVEMADRILPQEDEEISSLARKALEKRGIDIHTGAAISSAKPDGSDALMAVIDLGKGQESPVTVERILVAIGIAGNVENLGLENTRVEVDRGHVVVGDFSATAEPGIYAIGDVAGPPWLAHKASHEGVVCVEHIAGVEHARPLDVSRVPACTFSRPPVASIGMTEAAARAAGLDVRVGRFPFQANGMALALDDKAGMVKTVVDAETGEILGAHMIGTGVTELIHAFSIARTLEARDIDIIEAIFPHPTLSEMIHESVLAAADRPLNI